MKIVWASLDIIGHHLFVTWILFGHYFDSIWISFGLHLEFVWPSFGRDWNPNCKNKGSELQTFLKSDGWNTKSNSMRKLFQDYHGSTQDLDQQKSDRGAKCAIQNSTILNCNSSSCTFRCKACTCLPHLTSTLSVAPPPAWSRSDDPSKQIL